MPSESNLRDMAVAHKVTVIRQQTAIFDERYNWPHPFGGGLKHSPTLLEVDV